MNILLTSHHVKGIQIRHFFHTQMGLDDVNAVRSHKLFHSMTVVDLLLDFGWP